MKKLILLRGPSGTGKSTIAKAITNATHYHSKWCVHFEADMFHTKLDGTYAFDYERLSNAHKWCQLSVERSMFSEAKIVIVSNTSITRKECQTYIDLALRYDYEWDIIRTPGPWDVDLMDKRNTHGVPRDVLEKQLARYSPFAEETEWSEMGFFKQK